MSQNPLLDYLSKAADESKSQHYATGGLVDANGLTPGDEGYDESTATYQGDSGYSGVGTTSDSGGGTTPAEEPAPAGAVGKSADGGSWLDRNGNVIGLVLTTLGTPIFNNIQSGGQLNSAQSMLNTAGNEINNLRTPDLNSLIPTLNLQVQQGLMTPAQAQAALQQASLMGGVNTDAQSLAAQRAGLQQLADIANKGGMTDADRAQLAETMNANNANAASQRAAQVQALQMQGNGGTGAELAARLMGGQGAANANAMAGANIASSAQQRALNALQSGIQGNANLNTQQFQQSADKAKAQDVVNQFNAQAQNTIAQQNAANAQQANLNNFNTANTIAGNNTTIKNQQAMMPLNVAQQGWTNQLGQATAGAKAATDAGTALNKQGNIQVGNTAGATTGGVTGGTTGGATTTSNGGTSGTLNGVLNTVGQIGGAVNTAKNVWDTVSGWFADGGLVTNNPGGNHLADSDVDKMMADLTAYKYRYKPVQQAPAMSNNEVIHKVLAQLAKNTQGQ